MSYGIGLAVKHADLKKRKISYCYCDWMLPITLKVNNISHSSILTIIATWFSNPSGLTTLDKLKSAPVDHVTVFKNNGEWYCLKNRKPLDCSKGSINHEITLESHLNLV